MATTANSAPATTNHSPRFSSGDNYNNLNSPKSHRAAAAKPVSPAWTEIVRGGGGDSETIAAVPSSPLAPSTAVAIQELIPTVSFSESPTKALSASSSTLSEESVNEGSDNGNGNAGKKVAWNKLSNGAVEVGPVMGADSWPALSESARASQKLSSDSVKAPSDGSVPVSQGIGIASATNKQVNTNPNSNQNHTLPSRPKSVKRHGGIAPANGGVIQPPTPPGPVVEVASSNNSSNAHKNSNWETGHRVGTGSHMHGGNDHSQPRSSRKGNGGPHLRGDGSFNHHYWGRRGEQDRTNRDWNSQRRDAHMQPPGVRSFGRPPPPTPNSTQFYGPPPLRPLAGFPEHTMVFYPAPQESLRGVTFLPPMPPPMFFPVLDPQLNAKIVNQIDYYFSTDNLIKDTFLRQNMDNQGWVPIKLIAGFKKVLQLTDNIHVILDAVRTSTVVEVQGDKVRKRNDWRRWVMPPLQFPTPSGPQSLARSGHDTIAAHVQDVTLEEKADNNGGTSAQVDVHVEAFQSLSLSGDLNSQSLSSGGVGTAQVNVHGGSDRSVSAKNSSKRESC